MAFINNRNEKKEKKLSLKVKTKSPSIFNAVIRICVSFSEQNNFEGQFLSQYKRRCWIMYEKQERFLIISPPLVSPSSWSIKVISFFTHCLYPSLQKWSKVTLK